MHTHSILREMNPNAAYTMLLEITSFLTGAILQMNNPTTIMQTATTSTRTSAVVVVQVMSESLCIDCQRFFQQSLLPTYRTLGPSVIDLEIIPFGNSRIVPDVVDQKQQQQQQQRRVLCQHGEAECDANSWQQCAVDQYPATSYIDFFDCLEDILPMGHREEPFDESIFEKCASTTTTTTTTSSSSTTPSIRGGRRDEEQRRQQEEILSDGMDFAELKACHDNPIMAWELQVKYSSMTPADHTSVPWVLVDHQYVDVEKEDFFQKVCQSYMYKGGSHPACASHLMTEWPHVGHGVP